MHAIEFLRNPAEQPAKPVYAVYGDDAFLRREVLSGIAAAVLPGADDADDLSTRRFSGDQASLADVLDEVRTLPFFTRKRLVIVDAADPFVSAHRRELESYVEEPSESGTLVLSVKVWPATTKLAKLVDRLGLAIECKGPHERELQPWLVHLARSRFDALLHEEAARLLIELAGPEVGILVSDLEKLAVYVGPRREIRSEDVTRMIGAGRIENIWKVLDAATTGRGALALEDLDGLLSAGESPVGLLRAMSFSLIKVYHAGRLRRARVDVREACRAAGIYPYLVEKTQQQHAHLGPSRVDGLPDRLLRTDLDLIGSSQLDPRTIMERLLVLLSTPRQD
jgi:DNA polymerase-3 subunit delta